MTTKKLKRLIICSWLIVILCLPKHLETKPAGIPIPPGTGKLKSAVACENQKAFIVCPNIFNGIDVLSAMFGRQNSLECLPPGDSPASFCTDQEDQVKQQVKDLCQGEDKCEISASNDFLAMEGTQVCPQVSKYLEVKYRCVPKDKIPNEYDEYPNVAMETLGGQDVKSSIASEMLSSSSSPASEVQVLLGSNSSPKDDNGAVIDVESQPNSSENSQEVTESLKGGTMSTDTSPNEVHETIARSSIGELSKEEEEHKNNGKISNKDDSVLDDAEAQSRTDDKYWR